MKTVWRVNGSGKEVFHKGWDMHAPSKPLIIQWVKTAWDAVCVQVINKFFQVSRIALNPDGSEDDNFHCIQTDGVATQARKEFSTDAFTDTEQGWQWSICWLDYEDDEELKTDETVIDGDTD